MSDYAEVVRLREKLADATEQVSVLQAELDKLKIANDYHKKKHGHYALEANQVREERDKLKKAVLLWYNGSPEDAECDQQLCEIAALLGDKP